jgi:hypothetical protein
MQFRPDGGDAGFDARRAAAAAASSFSVPSCSSLMLSLSLSVQALHLSTYFLFLFLSFLAFVAPCVCRRGALPVVVTGTIFFLIKIFMHLLVWE